jgi:hypothetical protein
MCGYSRYLDGIYYSQNLYGTQHCLSAKIGDRHSEKKILYFIGDNKMSMIFKYQKVVKSG